MESVQGSKHMSPKVSRWKCKLINIISRRPLHTPNASDVSLSRTIMLHTLFRSLEMDQRMTCWNFLAFSIDFLLFYYLIRWNERNVIALLLLLLLLLQIIISLSSILAMPKWFSTTFWIRAANFSNCSENRVRITIRHWLHRAQGEVRGATTLRSYSQFRL